MQSSGLAVREAVDVIQSLPSEEEIRAFVEGDDRKTVIRAAEARIAALSSIPERPPKEGQVNAITQPASDFKDGVQRVKSVTGADVVRDLRARGVRI